jgi:hypothetical protein
MNDDENNGKPDTAGDVRRRLYDKSDKVNAHENQNKEFQEGYRTGANSIGHDGVAVIEEEHMLRKNWATTLATGSRNSNGVSGRHARS